MKCDKYMGMDVHQAMTVVAVLDPDGKVILETMVATEAAQRVIDRAVQLFGGLGVTKGVKVEELYREIRALRIYEGATEVQKIVIARELLKNRPGKSALAAE